MLGTIRKSGRRRLLAGAAAALSMLSVVALAAPAQAGDYVLTGSYTGGPLTDVKGWTVEWKVPAVTNQSTAHGAIGQWYDNLETGLILWAGEWEIYFYSDNNGVGGFDPSFCHPNNDWRDEAGNVVGGACRTVAPNTTVKFKYEWCTTANEPSVTGSQRCAWVDVNDGAGWRFLAQDDARAEGPEMYTHELETWDPVGSPITPNIPCHSPIVMKAQQRKTAAGNWVTMTGTNTWTFNDEGHGYHFQNPQLNSVPASWEACSD